MVGKCSVAEPHPRGQPTVSSVHSKMNIGHRVERWSEVQATNECNSKRDRVNKVPLINQFD